MTPEEIESIANHSPEILRDFLIKTIENCSSGFLIEFFKTDLGLDSDLQDFIHLKD